MVPEKQCTSDADGDSPDHSYSILSQMISDPLLKSLCDVVLIVGDERFPAHKVVLAASSKVFRAMFTSNMKEKNMTEVRLKDVKLKSWNIAFQQIYNGHVEFRDDSDALLALESARMYNLESLENLIEKYLISTLHVWNCFRLVTQADYYSLMDLFEAGINYLEENFEEMAESRVFLACPKDILMQIIPSENLVIKSELSVFNAVIRWVEADILRGMSSLNTLMEFIRLDELTESELAHIGRNFTALKSKYLRKALSGRTLGNIVDDLEVSSFLASYMHFKPRIRWEKSFRFCHQLRSGVFFDPTDDQKITYTPWRQDLTGNHAWRLKIFPMGYNWVKGEYLSMYLQAQSRSESDVLDFNIKFDLILVNRKDPALSTSQCSSHRFVTEHDHWGFHKFIPLSRLKDAKEDLVEKTTNSVLVGANIVVFTTPDSK